MFCHSIPLALAGAICLVILYQVATVIYNLYFHPLRKFPGPFWWRASRIPWIKALIGGVLPIRLYGFHEKYGPIVRIAPDELIFNQPEAWKDVYGHRVAGSAEFAKSRRTYNVTETDMIPKSILNESREGHAAIRRGLSYGFSEKRMKEQEPIINMYADMLMQRLHELAVDVVTRAPKPVDMMSMYNYFTFDVIGDLSFGEPFGCLKETKYHPWVKSIFASIRGLAWLMGAKYLGMDWLVEFALKHGQEARKMNAKLTDAKLKRRMAAGVERPDFIEGLLKRDECNFDYLKLRQNAGILIAAGSETTATLLSGVTYLLCTNPQCMEKLKKEVRSTFKSENEITFTSVNSLTYMFACLNEAMRMYPPIPSLLPRRCPKGGAMVAGAWVPENTDVAVCQWAMYHSSSLWTDPFEYHPERFLGDEKFAYDRRDGLQPFSVGPRNCIGKNLAYAEMRLILARIIFNFDLTLSDESRNWMDQKIFLFWEKGPLYVYLTRRSTKEEAI